MNLMEKFSYIFMLVAYVLLSLSIISLLFNGQYFFILLGSGLGILVMSAFLMMSTEIFGE